VVDAITLLEDGWVFSQSSPMDTKDFVDAAELRGSLVDENERDHDNLINGWRSVLLRGGDERTRQDLMLEASQGSYDALLAIGSVTELSPEAVGGFIGSLHQTIAQQLEDAPSKTGSMVWQTRTTSAPVKQLERNLKQSYPCLSQEH